jgi:hypothetical protein
MFSKFLDPLARPIVIVVMASTLGLLVAISRAFEPAPFDAGQPPAVSGLIAAIGVALALGVATVVFDVAAWLADRGEQSPTEQE